MRLHLNLVLFPIKNLLFMLLNFDLKIVSTFPTNIARVN
jgi:hypothetical protein